MELVIGGQVMAIDKEEMKRLTKEAITEWLDAKFAEFGRWSLLTFAALAFGALVYFILKTNGWHRP